MKLQSIIIALSVTVVSTSLWPWESLVCTVNSTCNNDSQCNASCQLTGTYGPANIIIDQLGCSCDPQTEFNFTISPPNYKLCPATTVKQTVSVTPTPHSEYKCLNNTDVPITLASLTDCNSPDVGILCQVLITLGSVITLLVAIVLVLCIVITCLVARGKRYQYTPNVVLTQNSAEQNQVQEQQPPPQSQDSESARAQQTNLYHILDPQYETVVNKTTQPRSEPAQYCEPELSTKVQLTEVSEQKGLKKSGSQSSKLKASLEKIDEQETSVFYDELTGPGYPKSLKSSKHSATSLPIEAHKYSSLEQEQQNELIPLYSMPDKSKKKDKDGGKKMRETEQSTSHNLTVRSPTERKLSVTFEDAGMAKQKSPSPPPPELPPKPGQASKVTDSIQEEELEDEESAYAEVSSKPMTSAVSRNRTPGAIGTTVSPLHLMAHNPSSPEREKGSFQRSHSVEGYFGGEALHHQKASDVDFHRLYGAPMTMSLHTRGMEPPQERQEDEEGRHGFFRAS